MKKYIIFTAVIGMLFLACNPNKDIYDMIDAAELPYHETFDYELTDADYTSIKKLALSAATTSSDSTIAYDLDTYNSFSITRSAADLIPAFLENNYIALDSASSINIKYKYSVNEYDSISVKKMLDADYTNMFGIADTCFSSVVEPSEYLIFADVDTTSNYVYYFSCRYGDSFAAAVDTNLVFVYEDGAWVTPSDFHIFSDEDYNSVGITGNYLNFSASKSPEHYLPVYLKNNYPYAFDNDKIHVVYKYYDGSSTASVMDAYVFDGTGWVNSVSKISPFVHSGTEWVFDPTIRYTMALSEDYQIVIDYVANNPDIPNEYLDAYYPETAEYYYGASSYYNNFYLKLYKRRDYDPLGLLDGLSDEEASEAILLRINEAIGVFLEGKYPDAVPVLNGVQVYYAITYNTYGENSVRNQYTVTYKCINVGEFEYTSGPELVE
ncbi:MAG: hypothetical protein L3J35_04455 [Bacteroidales bacterium]|nr:hypothetical protein [Bacteroidales bacterium]